MRVGQPSGSPDPSAALDVSGGPYSGGSQYRGIAPPKVALIQSSSAAPVTKPVTGLLVYNTATSGDVTPGYYYWDDSQWARFNTTTKLGRARVQAVNGQSIPAYSISQVSSLNTDIIYIADPDKEGMFRYASGSTATADEALVLNASNGKYLRILPDNRITPQMFGAIADDANDDGTALQKWIDVSGPYEHYLPAGTYRSRVALIRRNKRGFTLTGAGMGKSFIQFTEDTDGIRVENILNQDSNGQITNNAANKAYGQITLSGFEITSTNQKTGKEALYINSETEQRPGPTVSDVMIRSTINSNFQWSKGLRYHNCSSTNTTNINVYGLDYQVTTALSFTNDTGRPSVEHNVLQFNFQSVNKGVDITVAPTTTNPNIENAGIEGIQFTDGTIIAFQGIVGTTPLASPGLGFKNVHINIPGVKQGDVTLKFGEAIHLEGFHQLNFSGCFFYVEGGTEPTPLSRALYFKDVVTLTGNLFLFGKNNISNLIEFGTKGNVGGLVDLDLSFNINNSNTNIIYMPAGYSGTKFGLNGLYNGPGSRTGTNFVGPGASTCQEKPSFLNVGNIADKSLVQYQANIGAWKPVSSIAATAKKTSFVDASTTIDPSSTDNILVYNPTSNTITIEIDEAKAIEGAVLNFSRFDESSGPVVIQHSNALDNDYNNIQGEDGVRRKTYQLGIGVNGRASWTYSGGQLFMVSGTKGIGGGGSNNLADLTNPTVARANLELGSAATKASTDFIPASSGKLVPNSNLTQSISTASWNTTSYYKVIEPGSLADGTIYLFKVVYDNSGL
ncbi:glycoside hydrolase family 55 protein [Spirosoma sp. RP8]|uniref:Glycoside hydrolase family 55 protein n=1 Tax=Spirosoma liriopis TaxID=2937440 RepID=A0ABT0HRK1_9BACT|nr:glycoside hydrolase family 55 protein [Spirosoma liriopis]MCK8494605.1 glycoside hydrolase family 55 protein [Spirosoma liriopis]